MRSTLDIVDLGYRRAINSPLNAAVAGNIYKHQRPFNSTSEGVVINCLPISGGQLQDGIMNVNIHVPNLVLSIGGIQDDTQPDSARLSSLTKMAIQVFEDYWAELGDVNFSLENQSLFEEPEINQHYTNLRLRFNAVNV